ncbi:lasso peptide biosynthesis PqqD family chaperone [Peribacillus cavernae]|uniref:Lasso peptide biosynthesis PqqD family chaperone n=1 Tax=Peribacillus cavernae TaxID=1674310 RepID=A0A3S0U4V3_9BACI|nr:lasso peptide biosynthesis PqqD family chaperone [Peribacillus cavernae]MDQ0217473.1 hypothetical protein [Peribacillus cavernae]RUQ30084.1 lasso peptide biosynthesis PqqD family chaperone [Peribacillus cavernae]
MIKNQSISVKQLVSQGSGNIVSDMDGETVMLSVHNGKYYNLGEMGGEIWERIKEPISVQELITVLGAQYDVERTMCEEQVLSFLSQLLEEGLIKAEG